MPGVGDIAQGVEAGRLGDTTSPRSRRVPLSLAKSGSTRC